MTVPVFRLPFSLDPLIAEAKGRARQRRLLVAMLLLVVAVAGAGFALGSSGSSRPVAALGRQTAGRQPATWGEIDKMSFALTGLIPASGTYVGVAWLSSMHRRVGLVLLYPGRLLKKVQVPPAPQSQPRLTSGKATFIAPPSLLPKTAKPVAAYLVREQLQPAYRPWFLLRTTLLRGRNVNRLQLSDFCAVGRRVASDLVDLYCH
jgi:hypothetical protein